MPPFSFPKTISSFHKTSSYFLCNRVLRIALLYSVEARKGEKIMARKPTTYNNKDVKLFLHELDTFNYFELPRWVDDCFAGACGQIPGNIRFSSIALFNIVHSLDEISTETVLRLLNRRKEALGEPLVTERYSQYIAKAARCASQAIAHHKLYQQPESEATITPSYVLPYTDDEMRVIKYLSLNAPFSELVAYEKILKENYGIS